MATVVPTINANHPPGDGSVITYSWTMVTSGDTGAPMPFAQWSDRSVQLNGTWGGSGGTITLEVSNDGTNYETANDAQTNPISKTANAFEQIVEGSLWIRPRVSVADVTSVVVTLMARRQQPMRK